MWVSITGFIITDVGLSLLAIVAVALAGGSFNTLASRVHQNLQQYSLSLFIFQSAHYLLFHELDRILRNWDCTTFHGPMVLYVNL